MLLIVFCGQQIIALRGHTEEKSKFITLQMFAPKLIQQIDSDNAVKIVFLLKQTLNWKK